MFLNTFQCWIHLVPSFLGCLCFFPDNKSFLSGAPYAIYPFVSSTNKKDQKNYLDNIMTGLQSQAGIPSSDVSGNKEIFQEVISRGDPQSAVPNTCTFSLVLYRRFNSAFIKENVARFGIRGPGSTSSTVPYLCTRWDLERW